MRKETNIFLVCVAVAAVMVVWALHPVQRVEAQPAKPATPVIVQKVPKAQPRGGGETWYNANQGTLAWDAVTQLSDGTPIPEGSVIKYQVWRRPYSISSGEKVGPEIEVTQLTITFSNEGSWLVGVQGVRWIENIPYTTDISWSDNAEVCKNGQTFGFRSFLAILKPAGLRPIQ
jgi:hypothetical protein